MAAPANNNYKTPGYTQIGYLQVCFWSGEQHLFYLPQAGSRL